MRAVEGTRAFGHDVDHAEHGVRSVEHRPGAEDDLDVVDDLHGDAGASLEARRAVEGIVDGVAVDEQEEVVALVAREHDAARPDVDGPERVRRHRAERQEIEGLVDRVNAVDADVLGGEDRGGRGSGGASLGRLRRGGDDRLVEQRLDVERIFGEREPRAEERREEGRHQEGDAGAAHSYTVMSLRTVAVRATFCSRA